MNNLKIKINGREVQTTENINAYNLDGGLDLGRSIESCGVISEEAFEKSCEGFGDDVRQEGLVAAIIKKFKELKDWIIAKFKALIGFIRNLINRIFHRSKIKDIELSKNVANEDVQKKNQQIDEYNQKHENKLKRLGPISDLLTIAYTDFSGQTTKAVVDISGYKQYAVLQNIKSIPIYMDPNKFKSIVEDILNSKIKNDTDPSIIISEMQKLKTQIFDNNVSEDNIKLRFIDFGRAFTRIKSLDNMTNIGMALGKKIDDQIDFLRIIKDVNETERKRYKVMNLFASLVTSYTSAYIRILMEITRLVETESRIFGAYESRVFAANNLGVKIRRLSFDSYVIDVNHCSIAKDTFTEQELNTIEHDIKLIHSYESQGKSESWKYPELNQSYSRIIKIFGSKSNQIKSLVGKITPETAFTMYEFNIVSEVNYIVLQGNIVIDNRKRIDPASLKCLYHTSYADLTEISSTSVATKGMGNNYHYGQAIATFGEKCRVYAAKWPVLKNGIPITNEAMAKYIKLGTYCRTMQDVENWFNGMHVYEINSTELQKCDGIYADPEHNAATQKLIAGNNNIKDNCVYVESDKPIQIAKKHPVTDFINYNEIYRLMSKY